jgi:hypothetical protein
MRGPSSVVAAAWIAAAVVLSSAPPALAQPSGSTLSPDFRSYMVNKDLGAERWTINLNLFSTSLTSVINVTGNIFRSDGGPASFVTCLVRADSDGTLASPSSTFRLSCSGADACTTTADQCARESWTLIDDDVRVPASFFLPPGGNGAAQASARADDVESFLDRLVARLSAALAEARRWTLARGGGLAQPRSAWAQASARGATLTVDRLNHLVTKDVGGERWSISYSLEPVVTPEGGVVNRFLSVTGNVYQPDGSPPAFVFCRQREDSTGTLSDPSSEFRFSCQGADACESTASECAESAWTTIADDVRLQASFFLPPQGLPASPQSDSDILVIGRTSDPPSVAAPEFATQQGAAAAAHPAGGCPEDAICFVPVLGTCEDVQGRVALLEGFGCACVVDEVPASCIGCGGGASGQCGTDCEYAVGGATARGTCLPFDSESDGCICYAIGAGEDLAAQGCGGATLQPCPGDRCCANDPRGSCLTIGGEISCPGICVDANGCDPDEEQCGICQSPPDLPTPTPTPDETPTPTAAATATPTAAPTQTPVATASPTPTPTPEPSPTPTSEPTCLGQGASCSPLGGGQCCPGLQCQFFVPGGYVCNNPD